MGRIGFGPKPGELVADPLELGFRIPPNTRQPVNSTRYWCEVDRGRRTQRFDLYLPNLLIKGKAPKRLLVVLHALE